MIQTPYDCSPNYSLTSYSNPITFPYVFNGVGNQYGVSDYINSLGDPNCIVFNWQLLDDISGTCGATFTPGAGFVTFDSINNLVLTDN